jgi:hypothetical protein
LEVLINIFLYLVLAFISFDLDAKEPVRMVYHESLSQTLYDDIKNYVEDAYQSINEEIIFIDRPVGRGKTTFIKQLVDADLARMNSIYKKNNALYVPTSITELTVKKYCILYFCERAHSKKRKDLIGVSIRGGDYLKKIDPSLNIVLVDSKLQLVKMLLFGRADYIIAPFPPQGLFSKIFKQMGDPLFKFKIYHWVQNSHKHLIPKLDKYFKENPIQFKKRDSFKIKKPKKKKELSLAY